MSNGTSGTMNRGVWDLIGLHNIYTTHTFTGNFSGIFICRLAALFLQHLNNFSGTTMQMTHVTVETRTHTHKYLQPIWRLISLKQMVLTITLETFKSKKCQEPRGSCIIPKMFEYIWIFTIIDHKLFVITTSMCRKP